MTRILGAILAGGRSSRFGSDKAEALLHGRRLIDWARSAIEEHVDDIVVCGRDGGIRDRPGPHLGPLGGINAALHHARDRGFEAIVTVPCDVPKLPDGAIRELVASGVQCFIANLPVVGLWHSETADLLDAHIADDDRSVVGWARRVGAVPIHLPDPIENVNTQADLGRLAAFDG